MKRHVISFGLAFSGIRYALSTQPNFVIHIMAATLAISLGLILSINYLEWIVLMFTIVLVFATEMINTAIESMTDLITTEHRRSAKIAKDVSAGMVLTSAIAAVIVGIIIFGPKLLTALSY